MKDIEKLRGKKRFGAASVLLLVFVACVGTLLWLVWSEPDGLPASTSEAQSSEAEASAGRSSSSAAPASERESTSSESAVGSTATPARPVQPTGVGASVSKPASAQKLQSLTINAAVSHEENATYFNVFINTGGVALKNKIVAGDLVLSESIGNGAVLLQNVVVKGRILVNGAQTVTLRDVTAVQLIAQRTSGTTDYIIDGASTIHEMTARNQLTLDLGGLSANHTGVKKLTTEPGAPMWQQVTILRGTVGQIVTNDATNLLLPGGNVAEEVVANAPTHIGGGNAVATLTVRNDEVTYDKKPRNVEVEDRYSDPSTQQLAIGEVGREPGSGRSVRTTPRTQALATPRNLAVTAVANADDSVTLSFDPVANATRYTVIYSVTNGSSSSNITNRQLLVDTNSCTVTSDLIRQAGTKISFKVRAVSSSSRYTASDYSGTGALSVVQLEEATGLDVQHITDSGYYAVFSFDEVAGAARYTVSYTQNGADWTDLAPLSRGGTNAARVSIPEGTTVTGFTVTASAPPDATHIYLDSEAGYTP